MNYLTCIFVDLYYIVGMSNEGTIREKFETITHSLNERSRRLWAASEALSLGRGGIATVARATGIGRATIVRGIKEIGNKDGSAPEHKIRRGGGGRKSLESKDASLLKALSSLVDPETRGDPESPLLWTTKSTRNLAEHLGKIGYGISHEKVSQLLKAAGYSLQAPRKTKEGKSHPDRDEQFSYINQQTVKFQEKSLPVVSIDAKKKELVGSFSNGGREYQPKGKPEEVNVYDFPSLAAGRVTPYGIYDITHNAGWVRVGISKDTAQFAVSTLRSWWYEMGSEIYPGAAELLVHADGGGSNGSRNRLWKSELQKFSTEAGLAITVSHFPPGTSKWNKIEHRLFSQITKNWRGKPLASIEIIVSLIGATATASGLRVRAALDSQEYEGGIKISDEELSRINITRHAFHGGDWNYTIKPIE